LNSIILNNSWNNVRIILDATKCPINVPGDNLNSLFYNGKQKTHTLKYEVAVDITMGYFVWVSGPVPGSVHDIKLAYNSGILDEVGMKEYLKLLLILLN